MKSSANTCSGCYWNGKCADSLPCEDYDPLIEQEDVDFYQKDLADRAEEYNLLVEEMNS